MHNRCFTLCVHVLTLRLFLRLFRSGSKLTCHTCDRLLGVGSLIVSRNRSSAGHAMRCLDCAVEKNVLSCNVVDA